MNAFGHIIILLLTATFMGCLSILLKIILEDIVSSKDHSLFGILLTLFKVVNITALLMFCSLVSLMLVGIAAYKTYFFVQSFL